MRRDFLFATADTAINRHQPALLDIKLLGFIYHPLMVAVAAQGLALVLVLQRRFAKGNDISHERYPTPSQQGAPYLLKKTCCGF